MWKCDKCGNVTDNDFEELFDAVGELKTDGEYIKTCPKCGGEDFTEAERCPGCGRWTDADALYYDKACPSCVNGVKGKFEAFFRKLNLWEQNALDYAVTENAADRKSLFDIIYEGERKNV